MPSQAVPIEAERPQEASSLDAIVRRVGARFVEGHPERAVVVAVTTPRGRRVWGFGSIDRGGVRTPPDGHTLYEIGSVTKTFTGTLLADLAREGIVHIDDPVRKHLPDGWPMPTRDGREITLLHLTTHTSSLPRMPPGFGAFLLLTLAPNDPYANYREENLRLTLSQVELDRPIGSRLEYSNLGVGLLGVALANAADAESVEALFESRIARPLGLTDTAFESADDRLAPPFTAEGSTAHTWRFDCLKACGGLRSTADDMLTYAEAAAVGRSDTPLRAAFERAAQPWRQTCDGDQAIGFGWYTQPLGVDETSKPESPDGGPRTPARLVWHGGATGGYRAFLGLLPEHGSAVVVLSNSTAAVDPALTWPTIRAIVRESSE